MGILGAAYRALDPLLPFDKQLDPMFGNGILSQSNAGMSAMAPQAQMQPPEPGVMGFPAMPGPQGPQQAPQAPEKPFKPSLVDTIWGVAAGYSPNQARQMQVDAYAKRQAQQTEAQERAALMAKAQATITDPREWAVFMADPKEWAKRAAERYGVQNVTGGNTAVYGDPANGGTSYTAPKMGESGDQFYTQTADGVTMTGQRAPSYEEETGRMNAGRPVQVGNGGAVIDPATGRVIYKSPMAFAPRAAGRGGGSGDGSGPPPPPPGFVLEGQ